MEGEIKSNGVVCHGIILKHTIKIYIDPTTKKIANSPDPRIGGIVLDYQVPIEMGKNNTCAHPISMASPRLWRTTGGRYCEFNPSLIGGGHLTLVLTSPSNFFCAPPNDPSVNIRGNSLFARAAPLFATRPIIRLDF